MEALRISDFKLWKVAQLKDFLRKRSLKVTGNKEELVAMAYAAYVMKTPLSLTHDEELELQQRQYKEKLVSPDEGQLPDPFSKENSLVWLGKYFHFIFNI